MTEQGNKGYIAIGEEGANLRIEPMSRKDARNVAANDTRFKKSKPIGLVDLDDLAISFNHLVERLKVKNRRQLETVVQMMGSLPEQIIQDLFIELARRDLAPVTEADYKPFEIDRSALEELDEFKRAMWHDSVTADRDTVIELFDAALRARAIKEPTVGGHEVVLGLMAVAPHRSLPATDVFFRMYSPAFEHMVGDVLPLEGCEFFEHACEIAGTEEGPAFGVAVLELVLDRIAYVYRELEPYLSDEEKAAIAPPAMVGQGG